MTGDRALKSFLTEPQFPEQNTEAKHIRLTVVVSTLTFQDLRCQITGVIFYDIFIHSKRTAADAFELHVFVLGKLKY